jgi:hypothetical protein
MSDDSFIREVDEELRSERMRTFWARYGKIVIGVAVAIVVVTAGYRGYKYYMKTQAETAGDAFMAAISLSQDKKHDEAIKALETLASTGPESYAALARMRLASELAGKGDAAGAVAAYDAIAANAKADQTYRDIAQLRAGLLLVDSGSLDDVKKRVAGLAAAGKPFRHSAREALGLPAWKAGLLEEAAKNFNMISQDQEAPGSTRGRANLMLDLIAGKGGPARK